jgi:eukaryotic-like serine/threonine-protein kinase
MPDDRWQRVQRLFDAAVDRPAADRTAFLAAAAGGDEVLRRDVESLLAADVRDDTPLERWPVLARALFADAIDELSAAEEARAAPSLTTGSRLGIYDIVGPLGAGGMGEVYRARDPRLARDVAIKILPHAFVADPGRLARFEREARVLAALSHPHIGAIYGIEESSAGPALVLELVDGPTLAARIEAGPMPVDEALSLARQIADAISAAHEKGIVHRDLKPANVTLTSSGVVKVLDFGLAEISGADPAPVLAGSIDRAPGATSVGAILGTAAYISPEQARGQPVDKRSDIWAFGCVLFEMLTGHKAFDGDTAADTMTAVLEHEPDWRGLPMDTPPGVRSLVQRCLEKDREKRLQDIGDARIGLGDAVGRRPRSLRSMTAFDTPRTRRAIAVTGAAALFAALGMALAWRTTGRPAKESPPRFTQLTSQAGVEWFPSLSPDGTWIAYGGDAGGHRAIYLQDAAGETAMNLTADSNDDDDQPAFSPDGRLIAFRSSRGGGGIFVMGRGGERVRRVTRAGFRPAWSPDGREIAFSMENAELDPQNTLGLSALRVVDVASGRERQLGDVDGVLPSWSPHGHRIAYTTRGAKAGSTRLDVWTVTRSGADPVAVTTDGAMNWSPAWSPDGSHLYFVSGRGGSVNLWRVAVDEASGKTVGQPEPVTTPAAFAAHVTISGDGSRIAYSSILRTRNIQKLALDPATGAPRGDPIWITTGSRLWANPDPSPDGRWLAFYSNVEPEGALYIARSDGTSLRQLRSGADAIERMPRWSPDGRWIAFHAIRGKEQRLWKIRTDGSELQQLSPMADAIYPVWSPDGSRIAVLMAAGIGHPDNNTYIFDPNRLWSAQTPSIVPPPGDVPDGFVVNSWSPNGERLAGQAGLGAHGIVTYDLHTRTFDRLTDFGGYPEWLADSRHLLFVSNGHDFYVLDTPSGHARKVFSVQHDIIGPPQVTRDGRDAYFTRRITEGDIWLMTLDARNPSQ